MVVGTLLLLSALGMLAVGGVVLAINSRWSDGGYLTSDEIPLSTDGYAVAAAGIDLDGFPAHSLLGRARLRATSSSSDTPIFLGVARADDAAAYLASVEHVTLAEVADPATRYTRHPGGAPPTKPSSSDIWITQATGSGTQTIDWPLEQGRWTVVVMNADGAAGVDVNADVGATAPVLRRIAVALLCTGTLVALAGTLPTFAAIRPRKAQPHLGHATP